MNLTPPRRKVLEIMVDGEVRERVTGRVIKRKNSHLIKFGKNGNSRWLTPSDLLRKYKDQKQIAGKLSLIVSGYSTYIL